MEEYFELRGGAEVDASALQLPRAVRLLDAVKRHRDYAPVRLLRFGVEGASNTECILVDVECDGIAPKNSAGIRYRERLALCVPDDLKTPIEVLALRKDFPLLMHQNQGPPGAPASLCLYFESAISVARTWTPQGFLRRVQWWLEKSSTGELHAADQPLEQLFLPPSSSWCCLGICKRFSRTQLAGSLSLGAKIVVIKGLPVSWMYFQRSAREAELLPTLS
nr:hypothetical protein [Pseudomonas syringae]UVN17890.1 hypothetical protein pPsy0479a_00058 [Pseudomonas syringae]